MKKILAVLLAVFILNGCVGVAKDATVFEDMNVQACADTDSIVGLSKSSRVWHPMLAASGITACKNVTVVTDPVKVEGAKPVSTHD